ncbi:MAG: 4-(cytidine 5'-diphospho)-2-C-methyl-D-erythritol kinase [Clostridiales bacterium]|nr:4-(cytidine 5'-diphospho)-2-C-methyl-D-erythritol kinase [Clostridiales bacterium]
MDQLTWRARAKINLGLDVLRKRPDGYHDLRMVMQTIDLYDEITLRVVEPGAAGADVTGDDMTGSGPVGIDVIGDSPVHVDASGDGAAIRLRVQGQDGLVTADSHNLAWRAAELLMKEFDIREGLDITLIKKIPVAAGLAGGSTDAAAVLNGVNQLFELGLGERELMERGVRIGADVPYCIMGGTALAEGIGERLTRLSPAPQAHVLLAKPPIQVSTKFVYSNLRLSDGGAQGIRHPDIDAQVQAIRDGDLYRMAELMGNVLETVTIPVFPVIGEIRAQMMRCGAVGAMMSGSGPTVFGLFDDLGKAKGAYAELSKGELASEVYLTDFYVPEKIATGM